MSKRRLALILGSGFSKDAGLPTTGELSEKFLEPPTEGVLSEEVESCISGIIQEFWQDVFGYGCNSCRPSLEDHFTLLDLAANSGHQLGPDYPPQKLRAIRRMSIHRVFQILDVVVRPGAQASRLLSMLCDVFDVSMVTLNWDIVAEQLLKTQGCGVCYGIPIEPFPDTFEKERGIPLLKVHGSSNWIYCDCCRRLYAGAEKSALRRKAFLEEKDFKLFRRSENVRQSDLVDEDDRRCVHCGNMMAGRVATFSYRKAFSINQFQTIWEHAHEHLSNADMWVFVGYSMPQADFEFRHLLKSAQLARSGAENWVCEVVLSEDVDAARRYKGFFGLSDEGICQERLSGWVERRLDRFCHDHGNNR